MQAIEKMLEQKIPAGSLFTMKEINLDHLVAVLEELPREYWRKEIEAIHYPAEFIHHPDQTDGMLIYASGFTEVTREAFTNYLHKYVAQINCSKIHQPPFRDISGYYTILLQHEVANGVHPFVLRILKKDEEIFFSSQEQVKELYHSIEQNLDE